MRLHPSLNLVSASAVPVVGIAMMALPARQSRKAPLRRQSSPAAAAIYKSSHTIKTQRAWSDGIP